MRLGFRVGYAFMIDLIAGPALRPRIRQQANLIRLLTSNCFIVREGNAVIERRVNGSSITNESYHAKLLQLPRQQLLLLPC